MKIKTARLSLFLFLMWSFAAPAQRGFFIPEGVHSVDIPFEYNNNFIILQIVTNGRLPIRFILDTGAGHTILTKKELSGILGLSFDRSFQVFGSDLSQPLTAHLVKGVRFDLTEKVVAPREDILVLDEDFFQFEAFSGINVQGILSGNIFSRYIMKINYDKGLITLYNRQYFGKNNTKGYDKVPIELYREKPYIYTNLTIAADSVARVKLLLDTGASLPMLLFADTNPMLKPPSNAIPANIGHGLGGDIEGFTGRIKTLELGPLKQQNVVTYFQVLDTFIVDSLAANQRNGIIGNGLLNRFTIIFDYNSEVIWLKPARRYKEAFLFDRSGMGIILSGQQLDHFMVHHILPHSPASVADIRKGDKIVRIGRKSTRWMSLSGIIRRFQGKVGKKLIITIERDGILMKKEIILRDLL